VKTGLLLAVLCFVPVSYVQGHDDSSLQPKSNQDFHADVRVISAPYKDGWDKAAIWINGGLAIIGVAGVIIGICTLRKVERQISVAEADTRAMIRAERAWIVVSAEMRGDQFTFIAKNVGKTPARIKSVWVSPLLVTPRDKKLNVPSDEETAQSLLSTPPRLLPPTAEYVVHRYTWDDLNKVHKTDFADIRIYGRILYFDILNPDSVVPFETKWLYWQLPLENALPFQDPLHAEHNSYT
jgi:hypothetical protein